MSKKRYVVSLTAEERGELQGLIKRGKQVAARKRLHAQALLKADEGELGPSWTDVRIAEAYDIAASTAKSVRQRFVEETRVPIPMAKGRPARFDYEYKRNGVANLFMFTESLKGWRWKALPADAIVTRD